MLRVRLIRHAPTAAVRSAAFGGEESLEQAAAARASELRWSLPPRATALSGPEPACRETAACLGLGATATPALAGCAMGTWRGLTLEQVQADDPAGLAAWLSDPAAVPHGGESLAELAERVAGWMGETAAAASGFVVAVVDAAVIKQAIRIALDASPAAFWRLDLAPLTSTELHARGGRWTVRHVNLPLA